MGTGNIVRGRFAPTPSGRMHLGNLFAALLCWLDVRSQGGEMLLRMEDLDQARCHPEYARALADDLRWLGLDWDMGWQENKSEFLQSKRTVEYERAAEVLKKHGLMYSCYCSRKERLAASAPHASDGMLVYNGRCRNLSEQERSAFVQQGRRAALRIQVPHEQISFVDGNYGRYAEWLDEDCGDFIIRRSDGVFAYQLAVVVDDGEMGVNRVVRGRDLLSSTPRQIWLFRTLGYAIPEYCHTPLLTDSIGRRLSKREQDLSMEYLRQHTTPEKLLGYLAYQAGLLEQAEAISTTELIPLFSWKKVGREDRIVREEQPEECRQ